MKCIVCLHTIEKVSKEHVFPESIGGTWVIKNVCHSCNQEMGKKIDSRLNEHKGILWYRNLFQIKKGKRKIPSPFTERIKVEGENREIQLSFKNGEVESKTIPTFEEPQLQEDGFYRGRLTIEKSMLDDDPDKWVNAYRKKFNIDPKEEVKITDVEKTPARPLELGMVFSNKDLLPAFIKIAYEFTATMIPSYPSDPKAKLFQKFLKTHKISQKLEELTKFQGSSSGIVYSEVEKISTLPELLHLALLIQKKDHGLFCIVKIFSMIHVMKLSDRDNYLKGDPVSVIIDPISRQKQFSVMLNVSNTDVAVYLPEKAVNMPKELLEELRKDQHVAIYDKDKHIIVNDIKRFPEIVGVKTDFRFITTSRIEVFTIWMPTLLLKAKTSDTYFTIKSLKLNATPAYLNNDVEKDS